MSRNKLSKILQEEGLTLKGQRLAGTNLRKILASEGWAEDTLAELLALLKTQGYKPYKRQRPHWERKGDGYRVDIWVSRKPKGPGTSGVGRVDVGVVIEKKGGKVRFSGNVVWSGNPSVQYLIDYPPYHAGPREPGAIYPWEVKNPEALEPQAAARAAFADFKQFLW